MIHAPLPSKPVGPVREPSLKASGASEAPPVAPYALSTLLAEAKKSPTLEKKPISTPPSDSTSSIGLAPKPSLNKNQPSNEMKPMMIGLSHERAAPIPKPNVNGIMRQAVSQPQASLTANSNDGTLNQPRSPYRQVDDAISAINSFVGIMQAASIPVTNPPPIMRRKEASPALPTTPTPAVMPRVAVSTPANSMKTLPTSPEARITDTTQSTQLSNTLGVNIVNVKGIDEKRTQYAERTPSLFASFQTVTSNQVNNSDNLSNDQRLAATSAKFASPETTASIPTQAPSVTTRESIQRKMTEINKIQVGNEGELSKVTENNKPARPIPRKPSMSESTASGVSFRNDVKSSSDYASARSNSLSQQGQNPFFSTGASEVRRRSSAISTIMSEMTMGSIFTDADAAGFDTRPASQFLDWVTPSNSAYHSTNTTPSRAPPRPASPPVQPYTCNSEGLVAPECPYHTKPKIMRK